MYRVIVLPPIGRLLSALQTHPCGLSEQFVSTTLRITYQINQAMRATTTWMMSIINQRMLNTKKNTNCKCNFWKINNKFDESKTRVKLTAMCGIKQADQD